MEIHRNDITPKLPTKFSRGCIIYTEFFLVIKLHLKRVNPDDRSMVAIMTGQIYTKAIRVGSSPRFLFFFVPPRHNTYHQWCKY